MFEYAMGWLFIFLISALLLHLLGRVDVLSNEVENVKQGNQDNRFGVNWVKAGLEVLYRAVGKNKVDQVVKLIKKENAKRNEPKKAKS